MNGLSPQSVTVPTDAVTLHRRGPGGDLGEQIGAPVPVSEPGRLTFPAHRGEACLLADLLVAAWYHGELLCWAAATDEPWQKTEVHDGDAVSVVVPLVATLSRG